MCKPWLGYLKNLFLGLISAAMVLAVGCGGGTPDGVLAGTGGKAESQLPAGADEYGAYVHDGSDGTYIDALRVPAEEAQWDGRYAMYKAVPRKPVPFTHAGELNFWVEDSEAVSVQGEFFMTLDTDGCSAEDWEVVLLHFEGHRGTPQYMQYTLSVSTFQEGSPLWSTKGISGLEGNADVGGPWKVIFYKKPHARADCEVHSLRLEIPAFGQNHLQDVATCDKKADDPSYQENGQASMNLRMAQWEDCLNVANNAALAPMDLASEQGATVERYRETVDKLCDTLVRGCDSYGGSISQLYYYSCTYKKERLLSSLLDAYADLPGQNMVEMPDSKLFPAPSEWNHKTCYEAYQAALGGSDDAQVKKIADKAHVQCLINSQFEECLDPSNHYEENTQCFKDVVLGKKSMIVDATMDNGTNWSEPVDRSQLEGEVDAVLVDAISKASDVCETIVAFLGPIDGSQPNHGQLIWFDHAYCLQDALAVLALEIDIMVDWIAEVE